MWRRALLVIGLLSTLIAFGQGVAVAQTGTTTISQRTVPIGTSIYGPFTVSTATTATLTLNRTDAGGFNDLTTASQMDITIQTSSDGGSTWANDFEANQFGGVFSIKGTQVNTWTMSVSGFPNTRNGLRLVVNVTGPSAIVIDGSVSTS